MRFLNFYIGLHNQPCGAPFIDSSTTITRDVLTNKEIARYHGKSILLTPWKRDKYGDSKPQKALVIAKKL